MSEGEKESERKRWMIENNMYMPKKWQVARISTMVLVVLLIIVHINTIFLLLWN